MHENDLPALEETLSEALSKRAFAELFTYKAWRCYSNTSSSIDVVAHRFLLAHSLAPSIISTKDKMIYVYSPNPIAVLRWRNGDMLIEGALFSNGAYITLSRPRKRVKLLFISNKTAIAYRYPPDFVPLGEEDAPSNE
jgi:hypothetical protein